MNIETLKNVLSEMLVATIVKVDYKSEQLHGGTLGDVQLVSGIAQAENGDNLSYKVVLKTQKKWVRYNDPDSWRREYDLYLSELNSTFTKSLHWPKCYYADINNEKNEIQLWMEYIEGVSGLDLSGNMYEQAAEELGRFQGRLYTEQPVFLLLLSNLSKIEYTKNFYLHYRSWNEVYDYIRAVDCDIPTHICGMLIGIDEDSDEVFRRIEKLPIIFCHRDFWVGNIFYSEGDIVLIDWDTAGWGYLGEDIASLIADESDIAKMVEYYTRCTAAYYKGFSEYADVSYITDNCIYELIIIMYGYRLVEWYKFAESTEEKTLHLNTLQKIYEMRNLYENCE